MLTKNFKSFMALVLESNNWGIVKGMFAVKNVQGTTYYVANNINSSMPSSITGDFTLTANNPGISVGSGGTAATEEDYQLESTITSGLNALVNRYCGVDNNGNPFLRFDIMLTNTTQSDITIREIGYKQNLRCSNDLNGTSLSNRTCLLDRTVLTNAVTIEGDSYVVIRYILKTVISAGE